MTHAPFVTAFNIDEMLFEDERIKKDNVTMAALLLRTGKTRVITILSEMIQARSKLRTVELHHLSLRTSNFFDVWDTTEDQSCGYKTNLSLPSACLSV